ncbi:MAG TPA: hypothetical protein VM509_05955 [Planctomycetota bacterium]|nr:hypothetical protein [Planctomycetota bacterium]
MKPIRTLGLIMILGAAPAGAQDAPLGKDVTRPVPTPPAPAGLTVKEVRDTFTRVDADRSGALSAEEAAVGALDAAAFSAADADGDKTLNSDEFTVASEARASKLATGVSAELTAESTRLQALRRAQKSEELKRREAQAPGAARTAGQKPVAPVVTPTGSNDATAPAGPAAARRALAPDATGETELTPQEIRASIVRRLRNGEISQEKARVDLEAIDRRIANATATPGAPASPAPVPAVQPTAPNPDVRAVEEISSRRLRSSELEPAKPKEVSDPTIRRAEKAAGTGESPAGAAPSDASKPEGIRARIAEAQADLTRRLRNAEVTPEQAALEQAALVKRLRNAVESLPGGEVSGAPAEPSRTSATPAPSKTDPPAARARAEGVPPPAPTPAPEGSVPTRRPKEESAPPAPVVEPARTSAPAPSPEKSTPAPARPPAPEKAREDPKPARPAPAPKPDGNSGGG